MDNLSENLDEKKLNSNKDNQSNNDYHNFSSGENLQESKIAKDTEITTNDEVVEEVEIQKKQKSKGKGSKVKDAEPVKLSDEILNEKIQEALQKQNPKNRKKTIIISVVLLIFNLFFMFFIVKNLIAEASGDVISAFWAQGKKLWWLALGFVFYAFFIFLQVLEYKNLLKSLSGLRGRKLWKVSYDISLVGRYYDNITPLSLGGEPMQIVALSKERVSPAVATGIPIIKMLINTIISAVLAVVFFVFGLKYIIAVKALNEILLFLLEIFGVIGVIITSCSALFMFFLSTGTLFTRSFVSGVIKLLYKLKLVKNYRKTYRKTMNQVAEYKFSMKYLMAHKKLFFKLLFLSLLDNLIYSLFPCIVVLAFTNELTISPLVFVFICMVKYHLSAMASCFIPLPGGTGMMEISFIILFGMSVGDCIVWALLGWRFFSYYLILIHGFIHEMIKIFKNLSENKMINSGEKLEKISNAEFEIAENSGVAKSINLSQNLGDNSLNEDAKITENNGNLSNNYQSESEEFLKDNLVLQSDKNGGIIKSETGTDKKL